MSYILEALKKAEHQREIGQVPRIDSEHEPAAAGLSSRWGVIVVLVLLVNAGLLLALFWPDSPVVDLQEPVSSAAKVSPATRTRSAPDRRYRGNAAVVPQGSIPGKVLQPRHESTLAEDAASVASLPVQTAPVPHTVSTPGPEPARFLPVTPPTVAPVPPQVRSAPSAPPVPVPHTKALPVWPQVSTHIFEQLHGNLRLDVHVYSENPRDRFVLINLQKYHEGEQLQEGPVVDAITAEGVVLSLQGQQFLLRAQ